MQIASHIRDCISPGSHDEQSGGSVIAEVAGRAIRVVRTDVIERRVRHRSVRECARLIEVGNHSYVDDLDGRYTRQPRTVSRRNTIRPSGVDQYPGMTVDFSSFTALSLCAAHPFGAPGRCRSLVL